MRHFIDKDENVIVVSESDEVLFADEDIFEIPSFSRGFCASMIKQVGLFTYIKAAATRTYETNDSMAIAIVRRLKEMGHDVKDYYLFSLGVPEEYKWYSHLLLNTLYGGNNVAFRVNKKFIIPKEFIVSISKKWDGDKINRFIKKLERDGFISFS